MEYFTWGKAHTETVNRNTDNFSSTIAKGNTKHEVVIPLCALSSKEKHALFGGHNSV